MMKKNVKENKNELFTEKGSKSLEEIFRIVEKIQKKLEKVDSSPKNSPAI